MKTEKSEKQMLTVTMTLHKNVVRDVFLLLLSVTVIVMVLSALLRSNGTSLFNPFLPEAVSIAVEPVLSKPLHKQLPALVPTPPPAPARAMDELGRILERTADGNGTVIVTALNKAWAESGTMVDLFLESFHVGEGTRELLENLLIVALDARAFNRCVEIHPHCYSLKTRGVDFSAEKFYMSEDYLKMMWRRLGFLGDVLRRGYNIIFSDTDIMWLRNPMAKLEADADIQITADKYNGNPFDVHNEANTGYMFVRSNERTINFYRYWYLSRRFYPGRKEQDVLNIIKISRGFSSRGIKFMFLNTKYFGGFCERSQYVSDVYTMHANCCRGLKAKLVDLRQTLEDWSRYQNTLSPDPAPANGSINPNKIKWRLPIACFNSWFS